MWFKRKIRFLKEKDRANNSNLARIDSLRHFMRFWNNLWLIIQNLYLLHAKISEQNILILKFIFQQFSLKMIILLSN